MTKDQKKLASRLVVKNGSQAVLRFVAVKDKQATVTDLKNWLTFTWDKPDGLYTVDGVASAENLDKYPVVDTIGTWTSIPWSLEHSAALGTVAYAVSDGETRYFMQGVYLDKSGTIVATDGKRLCSWERDEPRPVVGIVPVNPATLSFIKLCDRAELSDKQIRFTCPDGVLTVSLIEGQFPNWRRVVPEAWARAVEFPRAETIKAAVKNLKDLYGLKPSQMVHLEGSWILRGSDKEIEVGPPQPNTPKVALNPLYLLEALKAGALEQWTFDNRERCLGCKVDGSLHLLMAMQLD